MTTGSNQPTLPDRLLDLLACPCCRGDIAWRKPTEPAAGLHCAGCGVQFDVVRGVPRFAPELGEMEDVAESFGFQWTEQAAGSFEDSTIYGHSESEEVEEFFKRMRLDQSPAPGSLEGLTILDAGCGSGRLTAALARLGADVIGVDISRSVEVAVRRADGSQNVAILQGNLLNPPVKPASFDLVWSEGVIHCTPDPFDAFRRLATLVKPGGKLYVWVYPKAFGPYRLVRDALPFAWRLPHRALLIICRALGLPLWLVMTARAIVRRRRVKQYPEVVFGLFDNLSPQYQRRYDPDEILTWYRKIGFVDVHRVSTTGVAFVGQSPETHDISSATP